MVLTALILSLVLITTMSIRLPSPFTQGYVHLGDTMIFLSVMLLGKNKGALAAGLGSRLADVLGGYTAYAPRTLVIKFLMAYIMGWFIQISAEKQRQNARIVSATEIMGMVLGGSEMVLGYALVDGFLPETSLQVSWVRRSISLSFQWAWPLLLYAVPCLKRRL